MKIFNIKATDLNNSTREKLQNELLTILDTKLNSNTRYDSFIIEQIESIINILNKKTSQNVYNNVRVSKYWCSHKSQTRRN